MEMQNQPLVSVPVVTYNSAETIVETLDSIYNQTYPSIELIVSDDCSTDNTVEIVRKWMNEHKDRFVRTELITIPHNKGVTANYNRAADACQGEWVKDFDGDDIMLPECIQTYVDYVKEYPDTIYLFGKHKAFGPNEKICEVINNRFDYSFFSLTQEEQLHRLLFESNCIPSTTTFYYRKQVKATGVTNDERIPLLEDWPKWINLLKAGVQFKFIDKVTVLYRVSESSLSTTSNQSLAFRISNALFYQLYQFNPEFKEGNKREAIEKWLRAQNTIHQNTFWYIIFKLYKIIVMHKIH